MIHCPFCTKRLRIGIPPDDNKERHICDHCPHIFYGNPKPIVGILPIYEGKILLCKRAIEPHYGKWTIPAGFMENGETVEQGALREADEEAGIDVTITRLHTLYSVPRISQVYLIFLGEMQSAKTNIGIETLDTKFVAPDDVDYDEIAFESVKYILKNYGDDCRLGRVVLHSNGANTRP